MQSTIILCAIHHFTQIQTIYIMFKTASHYVMCVLLFYVVRLEKTLDLE